MFQYFRGKSRHVNTVTSLGNVIPLAKLHYIPAVMDGHFAGVVGSVPASFHLPIEGGEWHVCFGDRRTGDEAVVFQAVLGVNRSAGVGKGRRARSEHCGSRDAVTNGVA